MEIVNITLDESSADFAIAALTDQYTNPLKAIIRELTSNALDATVNTTAPAIYYFITDDETSIRDNGCGMSLDFIKNTYSKYWGSSKREDNTAIGAYGLGSKAPLLACSSFRIDTTTETEHTLFEVSKEGGYHIKILKHETGTFQETGTKITLPIDGYKMMTHIRSYSENPRPAGVRMYLNGKELKSQWEVLLRVRNGNGNSVRLFYRKGKNADFNVRYLSFSVGCELYSQTMWAKSYAIEVLPGELNFNLSRDAYIEDKKYREYINSLGDYNNLILEAISHRADAGSFRDWEHSEYVAQFHPEMYDQLLLVLTNNDIYTDREDVHKKNRPLYRAPILESALTVVDCTDLGEKEQKQLQKFASARKRINSYLYGQVWFMKFPEADSKEKLFRFFGFDKREGVKVISWKVVAEALAPAKNARPNSTPKTTPVALWNYQGELQEIKDLVKNRRKVIIALGARGSYITELRLRYSDFDVYYCNQLFRQCNYRALVDAGVDVTLVLGEKRKVQGSWADKVSIPLSELTGNLEFCKVGVHRVNYLSEARSLVRRFNKHGIVIDDQSLQQAATLDNREADQAMNWAALSNWDFAAANYLLNAYESLEVATRDTAGPYIIEAVKKIRRTQDLDLSYPVGIIKNIK